MLPAQPLAPQPAAKSLTTRYKAIGLVFDVIAATVSLLDLTTDLIILITWYNQNRMIFFWISLVILILAQISYIAVFYFNHGNFESNGKWILSLLCTIPFAPFLSFIFYFVSENDSRLRDFISDYLCCFDFEWNSRTRDQNLTPQQQYLDDKLYKHLGFILEASVEAFPQSILQLTAIVYYNEPNVISILSILISMSSVCSKILLLVLTGNSLGWRMKTFIWLCFVVDFLGIFFIVSYAFHTSTNEDLQQYFWAIRDIYLYQFFFCILPFAGIGSLGLHLYWTVDISSDNHIVKAPLICCGITILWVIGLFITLLIMEIFCVIWGGMLVSYVVPSSRLPYKKIAQQFYQYYYDWISIECRDIMDMDNDKIIINKDEDKMMRLCIFNIIILQQHPEITKEVSQNNWETPWNNHYDDKLLKYLETEQKTLFKNVTLSDLRNNCDDSEYIYNYNNRQGLSRYAHRRHPNIVQSFYYEFYASMFVSIREAYNRVNNNCFDKFHEGIGFVTLGILTFICGPIYILSRFFNVLLPMFLVIFFYFFEGQEKGKGNRINYNLFVDLDTFQVTMWILYVILLIIWFSLGISIMREDYYLWHILPSTDSMKGCEEKEKNDEIHQLIKYSYFNMTMYPIIQQIVIHQFGNDIACVILQYFNYIELDQTNDNKLERETINIDTIS